MVAPPLGGMDALPGCPSREVGGLDDPALQSFVSADFLAHPDVRVSPVNIAELRFGITLMCLEDFSGRQWLRTSCNPVKKTPL